MFKKKSLALSTIALLILSISIVVQNAHAPVYEYTTSLLDVVVAEDATPAGFAAGTTNITGREKKSPSTAPSGTWNNTVSNNAYTSDNKYANTSVNGAVKQFGGYGGFTIPSNSFIAKVEAGIEAYTTGDEKLNVTLSWNGGTNWARNQTVSLSGADPNETVWVDFTAATSWDSTKLNDGNLRTMVKAIQVGTSMSFIKLDWIPVRVSYRRGYTIALEKKSPSSYPVAVWTNPSYAYSSDDSYATTSTNWTAQQYGGYGTFTIPPNASYTYTITKVEVGVEAFTSAVGDEKVSVAVSWDNGVTWSSERISSTLTSSDPDTITAGWWFDFTEDASPYGGWDTTKLGNLRVKIRAVQVGAVMSPISLDWIPARVSYGPIVPVKATPNVGYSFGYWLLEPLGIVGGKNVTTSTTVLVAMNKSYTLTAFFAPRLTINIFKDKTGAVGGTTNPRARSPKWTDWYYYSTSATASVTATANASYNFNYWELDAPRTERKNATTTPAGAWTDPSNAYTSNDVYATTATGGQTQQYGGYGGFTLPTDYKITKVEVGVEAYTPGDEKLNVTVSWDNGVTWALTRTIALPTSDSDAVTWVDFVTATAWDTTKLNSANFRVKVTAVQVGDTMSTVYLDWLPAKVTTNPNNSPISVPMTANHNLTAFFSPILTITSIAGGSINPPAGTLEEPTTYYYQLNTIVLVNATADTGAKFHHWEFNGVDVGSKPNGTNNQIQVKMTQNQRVHAVFRYNLTMQAYCYISDSALSVSILRDGASTGFTTPHEFLNQEGLHLFGVPATDTHGHQFLRWSNGETTPQFSAPPGATLIAYYWSASPVHVTPARNATTTPAGTWTNPSNAYTSNNQYATTSTNAAEQQYGSYGFASWLITPPSIEKVEVGVEAYTPGDEKLNVTVSWDGGATWPTNATKTAYLEQTDTDTTLWLDFSVSTSWTSIKLNDTNFLVKVKALQVGDVMSTIYLDWLPVKVTYSGARIFVDPQIYTGNGSPLPGGEWSAKINVSSTPYPGVWGYQFYLGGLSSSLFPPAVPLTNMNFTQVAAWSTTIVGTTPSQSPNTTAVDVAGWTNPANAYADDANYATTSTNGATQRYWGYGGNNFPLPPNPTITKVEVGAKAKVSATFKYLNISVSWNGGTNWSPEQRMTVTTTEGTKWLDFTTATSWTANKLNFTNFRVRVKFVQYGTGTMSVNWLPARVTFSASSPTATQKFGYDNAAGNPSGSGPPSYYHGVNSTATETSIGEFVTEQTFTNSFATDLVAYISYSYRVTGTSIDTAASKIQFRVVKPDLNVQTITALKSITGVTPWTTYTCVETAAYRFEQLGTYKFQFYSYLKTAAAGAANWVQLNWDDVGLEIPPVRYTYGSTLKTGELSGSSTAGTVRYSREGYLFVLETLVGSVGGREAAPVPGNYTLGTVTFHVDYGATTLDLYGTKLLTLNATNSPVPYNHEAIDGYFSNKLHGDVDSDKDVDNPDLSAFSTAYGSTPSSGNWDDDCDFNRDTKVEVVDLFLLGKNYNKSVP